LGLQPPAVLDLYLARDRTLLKNGKKIDSMPVTISNGKDVSSLVLTNSGLDLLGLKSITLYS
jgi:hypothetical protein